MNQFQAYIPAQAIEVEKALLRNLITAGNSTVDEVMTEISTPEIFYRDIHRELFIEIRKLHQKNFTIDLLTISEQASNDISDLALDLVTENSHTNNIQEHTNHHYVLLLKEKYIRRMAMQTTLEMQRQFADETTDNLAAFFTLEKSYQHLSEIISGSQPATTLDQVISQSILQLNKRIEDYKAGKITGVPMGIRKLNQTFNGWQPGDLYVLAGRPGMGKTAIMLHFAREAAANMMPVQIFSLEMSNVRLADRLILSESNIDSYTYRRGSINHLDYDQVLNKADYLTRLPIYIDEKSSISIDYIVSSLRVAVRKHEIKLAVIDYLQLMDMQEQRGQTRDQAIGRVTGKLKALAKELKIPIILLSQLSREVEKRSDKAPILADLRESGNIEQDADVVIFLYRPEYYDMHEYRGLPSKNTLWMLTSKYREGEPKAVIVSHNANLTKFTDYDG